MPGGIDWMTCVARFTAATSASDTVSPSKTWASMPSARSAAAFSSVRTVAPIEA